MIIITTHFTETKLSIRWKSIQKRDTFKLSVDTCVLLTSTLTYHCAYQGFGKDTTLNTITFIQFLPGPAILRKRQNKSYCLFNFF